MKPSTREYKVDGATLVLYTGSPLKLTIAQSIAASYVSEGDLYIMAVAGFWIMEGLLAEYETDPEKYPSISEYLKKREGLAYPRRWDLYLDTVQANELELLRLAHDTTRQHVLETMTGTPLDQKKS